MALIYRLRTSVRNALPAPIRKAISRLRTAVREAIFAGTRHECPICGHRCGRFAPGPRRRPNARCPQCRSEERHRALWLWLQPRITGPGDRLRILHVAPEAGISRQLCAMSHIDYVTTDAYDPSVMVKADLTKLPLDDASFDLVICNHVLEHIPDDVAAMSEIRRVLRPTGEAVMQHPIDADRPETFEDWSVTNPEDRERVFFQHDHVRIYGADFGDRLRKAGFASFETITMKDQLDPESTFYYGVIQHPSAMPERDIEADVIYVAKR